MANKDENDNGKPSLFAEAGTRAGWICWDAFWSVLAMAAATAIVTSCSSKDSDDEKK